MKSQPNIELLEGLALKLDPELLIQTELGITNAVWHGIKRAGGSIIAVMDGDGTHEVEDLMRMLGLLNFYEADLVVGVRRHFGYPLMRRIISLAFNLFTRLFLRLDSRDPMSAFYVGRSEAMLFENVKSCKFGVELQLRAKRMLQVEIRHKPRASHKSHLRPQEALYLIQQLVRLRAQCFQR